MEILTDVIKIGYHETSYDATLVFKDRKPVGFLMTNPYSTYCSNEKVGILLANDLIKTEYLGYGWTEFHGSKDIKFLYLPFVESNRAFFLYYSTLVITDDELPLLDYDFFEKYIYKFRESVYLGTPHPDMELKRFYLYFGKEEELIRDEKCWTLCVKDAENIFNEFCSVTEDLENVKTKLVKGYRPAFDKLQEIYTKKRFDYVNECIEVFTGVTFRHLTRKSSTNRIAYAFLQHYTKQKEVFKNENSIR